MSQAQVLPAWQMTPRAASTTVTTVWRLPALVLILYIAAAAATAADPTCATGLRTSHQPLCCCAEE
jgi:hypothetical protein